ncbi:tetratricopeptide repeat protein [Epilithonimonas caeni]|uniref:tetratricopeptide repeat protein n=1 Tax=Epilithonimonas caeni TaxID=365343 RepID=UPI000403E4A1|nr:tetratricopeptide repeat protein [Epilithonimonas caeni]
MQLRFLSIIFFFLFFSGHCFGATDAQKFATISNEVSKNAFIRDSDTQNLLKVLEKISANHPELVPKYLYWKSFANYAQGVSDPRINTIIRSKLKFFDEKKYPFENALLLNSLAYNDVITGNYTDSFTNSLKALVRYKELDSHLFKSRVELLLGVICFRTRNFDISERFYKQSLSTKSPEAENLKAQINMYCAQAFTKAGPERAVLGMVKMIPAVDKLNNLGVSAVLYLNIGGLYMLQNKPDTAHRYYQKAMTIGEQIENRSFMTSLLINESVYSLGVGNFKDAESYIEKAEKLSQEIGNAEQLSLAYNVKYTIYEKEGSSDKAFFYLKKYNDQKEKILSNSKTIDSYQAYVSAFMASAEKELMISKQKTMLEKRKLTITLISSVFIILMGICLSIIFYQKKKQQSIIKESEKEALRKQLIYEKSIQQIQEEKHKELLDAKVREVTSYSLLLSNKNNVLQEILQKAGKSSGIDGNEDEGFSDNIIDIVRKNLNTEVESQKFIHHFNEVHPEFFSKLKSICRDLTENNLRMCAYFKMGISMKQVAVILNVSTETVKNARYRLKKKLMLTKDDSLDDFVRNI